MMSNMIELGKWLQCTSQPNFYNTEPNEKLTRLDKIYIKLIKGENKRKKQREQRGRNLLKSILITCFSFFFFSLLESLASAMTSSNKAARGSWEPYALWYSNSSGLIWRQKEGADNVISISAPGYFIWGKAKNQIKLKPACLLVGVRYFLQFAGAGGGRGHTEKESVFMLSKE